MASITDTRVGAPYNSHVTDETSRVDRETATQRGKDTAVHAGGDSRTRVARDRLIVPSNRRQLALTGLELDTLGSVHALAWARDVNAGNKNRNFGPAIVRAARALIAKQGRAYMTKSPITIQNPRFSGNSRPGRTPLFKNQPKCNTFVGEALFAAGVAMPTVKQKDGSIHYEVAGRLYRRQRHFAQVKKLSGLRPGDLIEVKFTFPPTWHCEILTKVDVSRGIFKSAGTLASGAGEHHWSNIFKGLKYDAKEGCWKGPNVTVYLLRPKRASAPVKGSRSTR